MYLFLSQKFKKEWTKYYYLHKKINEDDYEYVYDKKLLQTYISLDFNPSEDKKLTSKTKINITKLQKYAYKLLNNSDENIITLDSNSEIKFLKNILKVKNENIFNNYIQLICKLTLLPSEIYYEYINDDYEIKRSFPDFMIKTKNNNLFYIEIKNFNYDYDVEKTDRLEESYYIYSKKEIDKNKSTSIKNVILIILKWNGKIAVSNDGEGNFEATFYSKNQNKWVRNEIINSSSILKFFQDIESSYDLE